MKTRYVRNLKTGYVRNYEMSWREITGITKGGKLI